MNPFRPAWPAIATVTLLLAACSSPSWEKAGANETTVANDSSDCRVQARLAPLPERYMGSPTSQSVTGAVTSREEQRAMFESQEFQKCMTAKGYAAAKR